MKVNVILFSDLRRITGEKNMQLEIPFHATVKNVIDQLVLTYGDDFKTAVIDERNNHYKMNFSVNKKLCQADQQLKENDTLTIIPTAGGG
jgi:MoaD family protein